MAIGPVGAGKSTLLRALDLCGDAPDSVRKTQNVEYHAEAVDTPGEAFEIPYLYHMLITSSTRARRRSPLTPRSSAMKCR